MQAEGGWDLASVKTAMRAQGAISGCGAAGSDSKNMVRRRLFETAQFWAGFHTVTEFTSHGFGSARECLLFVLKEEDNSAELKMWSHSFMFDTPAQLLYLRC